jgi:hypothetical protein
MVKSGSESVTIRAIRQRVFSALLLSLVIIEALDQEMRDCFISVDDSVFSKESALMHTDDFF